jgi:diaminopimelate decarboxylase
MGALTLAPLAADLVAAHFGSQDGALAIGGIDCRELARIYGTPFYAYDGDAMQARYRALSDAVSPFARVYYSIKANPRPQIARLFVDCGAGLEIASAGEFAAARAAGCSSDAMLFAGPGKGARELETVLAAGLSELHVESFEEIALAGAIAARLGRSLAVAIRINPGEAAQGGAMRMGGKPAAFGFDEEILAGVVAAIAAQPALRLDGIHLFTGTQVLDAGVLLAQWRYGLDLAARLASLTGRPLARIDLGGGLGIPYHAGDPTLDLAAVAAGVPSLMARKNSDPLLRAAEVIIEPGRWLTGPAGAYVMAVRAVKVSRGQRFLVTDGGMHHHLAASGNLGQVIKRDFPIVAASRLGVPPTGPAQIVGPLCTPLDTLGRGTAMPDLAAGDLIAVLQSGAYGLTASPAGFLSHDPPAEILIQAGAHRAIGPDRD